MLKNIDKKIIMELEIDKLKYVSENSKFQFCVLKCKNEYKVETYEKEKCLKILFLKEI